LAQQQTEALIQPIEASVQDCLNYTQYAQSLCLHLEQIGTQRAFAREVIPAIPINDKHTDKKGKPWLNLIAL
jgi:hypothetical protein